MEKIIKYFVALIIVFLSLTGKSLANPYAPYKGTTLIVHFPSHPHFDAAIKILPEFTKETGIKVEVDQMQYLKLRQKQTLELKKPQGEYDLIAYVIFSKADYISAGQLESLSRYFMNPRLEDPHYEADDLIDGYVQAIGIVGGKRYFKDKTRSLFGIPFGAETSILAYRKDIFKKHGLKVPETYDELLDIACKIPKLEPGMGGLYSRNIASGHQAAYVYYLHLAPLGGRIFGPDWQPTINNKAGVKAARAFKKLADCGPRSQTSFCDFSNECYRYFHNGKAAMYLDTTIGAAGINDPKRSKVVGKVGWVLHPKGVTRASLIGGFGLGIPTNAKNKEAAFLLMQWLTSKKGDKLIALNGGNPSRYYTHFDPDVNTKYPYMKVFGKALKHADPNWRPIIPEFGKINADIGDTIRKILFEDLDPQKGLDTVAERTRKIMKDAGYYTWKK